MYRCKNKSDPVSKTFSKILSIFTLIGMCLILVFGLMYLLGINSYLDVFFTALYWNQPSDQFWVKVKGSRVFDYSWFLSNLNSTDSLCMLGIAVLCLAPVLGICISLFKTKGIYRVLLSIIIIEFIFAIFKPLI